MADHFSVMGTPLILVTDNSVRLNSQLELDERGVILHSRSGKQRNRDYRLALELLLTRLDGAGIRYSIYLDSKPVQNIPLGERLLHFDQQASISARFDELVRAMNKGSASHGAWRRLLIQTPKTGRDILLLAIGAIDDTADNDRLPAALLRRVTVAHIHHAVAKLLDGKDASNFALSREYDALTDDGVVLAPKKIFGVALEEALGIETHPKHFSAGWGTPCFELLDKAGLWIVPKGNTAARPKSDPSEIKRRVAGLSPTEEEQAWIEGNPKIIEHLRRERHPGLAKRKRAEFTAQHGRLICEQCGLDPIAVYGEEAAIACIEVHHHRVHVANMQPGHRSKTEDLKCLCANCHRILHRKLALGRTAAT
ncbi:HNH endonuclease [Phyllobacterium endophyticum]|uniref:HNH endonuclease n=1 Tax=Phyllobacterium endophyticum TaxID=1149773 RepID=UPI0011CB3113|nr:hypothetical protein [Phyllobacterium endophyticum]TXR50089.1 hypothetical protein FVA77_06810 [Phyllobacterium endophyticum]